MKRSIVSILLIAVLALALWVPALATESPSSGSGFYLTSDTISGVDVAGDNGTEGLSSVYARPTGSTGEYMKFYPGSDRLKVTIKNTDTSKQYLVLLVKNTASQTNEKRKAEVPTGTNLAYIDQMGNGGDLVFTVYPETLNEDTDLTLWITNSDGVVGKATLGYWNDVQYEEQPYMLGDVDENRKITVYDASCILQYKVYGGILNENGVPVDLTPSQLLAANVNRCIGNAEITNYDASLILQYQVRISQYESLDLEAFVKMIDQ